MWAAELHFRAQIKARIYAVKLRLPRNQSKRLSFGVTGRYAPNHDVQRASTSSKQPAMKNRVQVVHMGGQKSTRCLVATLFPPQSNEAISSPMKME